MAVNKLTYPSKDNAVQEKINEIIDDYVDLSNLSETGDNRLHALKGYEDAGELLTDAEGLVDVKKYAHSTFDSTKFTVVGSPTITNDGIISNITSANQVYTSVIPFSTSNTWKIKIKAKVNSLSATQRIFAGRNSINTQIIQIETSGAMKMWLSSLATGDIANNVSINYTASVGEILDVELVFTGTEYKVYINGNNTYTKASTTKISIDTAIFAFSGYGMGGMLGEQDLKQVQVTVDGIPVFSGNKTSIDTIKPDNYSIVGTPTITDDGVVSNITTSNYIKTPVAIPFATADTWDIECNVTFKANSSIQRIFGSADNNKSIIIQVAENTWLSWYISTNNSTYNLASNVGLGKNLVDGQKYKLRFSFTGTDYRFYFNDVEETSARISSTDKMADTVLGIFTGGTFAPMAGGQDLNSFKVHINGDLVYQPCLKIPYISSKSGSKVVDSVYCNRVADMYSQFGYSPYYTLSDTDFTLPQGELYGLINNSNKNTMRSTEFIVGTQTEITGSWTGTTEDSSLYDGKNINYFLPYAGSGNATLNLTLAGGTTTGAKPVYLSGTSYVTTHYGANSCINMTYNSTKGAWFVNADRDANTYDRLLYNNNLYSLEALTDGGLACGTKDGYKKIASGVIFDIDYPIIRTGNVNASSNFTGYLAFPGLNLQTTKASWTGTNRSMVYLVGTLSGKKFTIDSSVFTTTVPTSADGKVYIPLGILYSTYQIYFYSSRDLYAYIDGSFQKISTKYVQGSATQPIYFDSNGQPQNTTYTLSKSVPSDAVFTDTKNTAGSTDTSSKIFLVGATSQAANPQTYSHDTAFVDANGRLNSAAPASSANDTTVATTKWVKDQGYASGIAVDQTYNASSANAQSGVAIAGAGFLQNTATATDSLTISGSLNSNYISSINIGSYSSINASGGTALGVASSCRGSSSTALGGGSVANGNSSVQLGYGTNSTDNSLSVGFYNSENTHYNWQLLDGATGLIPDARLSTNIARTSDYVAKTGDTMTGALELRYSSTNIPIIPKNMDYTLGTSPQTDTYTAVLQGRDSNNKSMMGVSNCYLSNGEHYARLYSTKDINEDTWSTFDIGFNSNNESFCRTNAPFYIYGNLAQITNSSTSRYLMKNTGFDYTTTTAPASNYNCGYFQVIDKNDKVCFGLASYLNTSNDMMATLYARRSISGTEKSAYMQVWVDSSGNPHSSYPQTYCGDGQWIDSNQAMFTTAPSMDSSSDLEYRITLPNDGYKYEVLLRGKIQTGSTSGNYCYFMGRGNQDSYTRYGCGAKTRANSNTLAIGTLLVTASYVASGSKNLYISRSTNFTGGTLKTLETVAYRRIGTNS